MGDDVEDEVPSVPLPWWMSGRVPLSPPPRSSPPWHEPDDRGDGGPGVLAHTLPRPPSRTGADARPFPPEEEWRPG